MLIDDEAVGQAQAWREPHAARDDRGALVAEGNHVLAQYARAGARAADGHAMGIAYANELGHRRSAQQRREPQLIAAREEDAARLFEPAQPPGLLAVPPSVKVHHGDFGSANLFEQLLVAGSGLMHAARRGNDNDIGRRPT